MARDRRLVPRAFSGVDFPDHAASALGPGAADEPPIGAEINQPGIRWDLIMVVFLRLTATIWMIKAIGFWMLVLGLGDVSLADERRLRQAFIVGFAMLDCSAAVGLWLLSPWGKSLWLFVALAELALGASGYTGLVNSASALGAALSILGFFVLSFAVARQRN